MLLRFGYLVVAFVASIEGHGYGGGGGFQHSGGFPSSSTGALSGSPYLGLGFPGGSAASFTGSFGDGNQGPFNLVRNEGTVGTDFKLNGGIKKILESFRHGVSGGSGHAGHFSEHGGSGFGGGSFAGSGAGNSFTSAFAGPFGFSGGLGPAQKFEGEYQGEVVIGKLGHKHGEHGAAGTDVVTIRPGGHRVEIHGSSGDRIQAGISTGFGGLADSSGSNSESGSALNIGDDGHGNKAEASGDVGAQGSTTEASGTTLSPSGGGAHIQSNGNSFGGGFVQGSYNYEKNSSVNADLGDRDNAQQQEEDGKFGPSWTLDLGAGSIIHGGGNGNGQEINVGQEQKPGFEVSGTSDSGIIGGVEVNIRPSEQKHEQVRPGSSITLEGSVVDGSFGLPGFGFDLHGTGGKETKFEVSRPGLSGSGLEGGAVHQSLGVPGTGFDIHSAVRPGTNGGSLVGGVVEGSFVGPDVGFGIHGGSGQVNKHEHRGPVTGGSVESTFNGNTERPATNFNIQSHIKPAVSGSEGDSHLEVNIGGLGSGSNIHGGGSHENKHESAGLGVTSPVAGTISGTVDGSIIHGSSHENKHGSHPIGGENNIRPSFGHGNKLIHGGLPVGAQGNFGFGNGFPDGNGLNFGYVGNFNGYSSPNYFPQGGFGYTGGPISSSEFGVYPSSTAAPILTNTFGSYPSSTLESSGLISSGGTILKPVGGILIRHHQGSKDNKGPGGPGAIVSANKEVQVIGIHVNKQRPEEGAGINIGVGGTESGINLNIQGGSGHGSKHELVTKGPGAGHNGVPGVSGSHYEQKIDFGRPLTNGFGGSYFGGSFPESSTNFGGPLQHGFLAGNNQGPAVNFGINQEHKFEHGGAIGTNRYPVGSTGAPVVNFGTHEQKFEYGGAEGLNRYPVGSTGAPVANFGTHEQKFEYGGAEGSHRYPVGSTAAPVASFGSHVGHEQKYVHGAPGSKIGFTVEPAVNIGIQKESINEQNRHQTRPGSLVVGSVLNGNIGKPGVEFNVQHGSVLGDVHGHDGLVIPAQQNFNIGRPTTTDYKYSSGGSGHHVSASNVPNFAFDSSGGTTARPANINGFISGSTPRPVIDGFFDGIGSSSEQLGGNGPVLPSSLGISGSGFGFGSGGTTVKPGYSTGINGFFDGIGSPTELPSLVRPDSTGVSSDSSGITVKPEFGAGINGFFSGISNSRDEKRPVSIHSEGTYVGGASPIKVVSGGATAKPGFGAGIDGFFSGIGSSTEQITGKEPALPRPGYTEEGSSFEFGIGSGGSTVKPTFSAGIDGFFDGIKGSTEQFGGKGSALTRPGYTGEGSSYEFGIGNGGSTVKPNFNAGIDGFFDGISSSTEHLGNKNPATVRPEYTGDGSSLNIGFGGTTIKPGFSTGINGFFTGLDSSTEHGEGTRPTAVANEERPIDAPERTVTTEGASLIGHGHSGPELDSSIDKSQRQQENDNKDICGGPNEKINIRLGGSNNCENGIKIGIAEQQGGLKRKGSIVRISPPRFGFDAGFDGSKGSEVNQGFGGSFIGQGGLGGFNGGFDAGFDGSLLNQGGVLGQGQGIDGGFDSGFDGTKLTGFGTQGFAPGYFTQGGFGNQGSSLHGGFGLDAGFDGSGFGHGNGGYKQQLEVLPGGPIGVYRQEVHGQKTDETKKIKGGSEGSQGGSEGGLVAVSNQSGVKGPHGDLVVGIDSQNVLPGGPVGVSSHANGDGSFSSHGDVGSSGLHSGIGLGGDISGTGNKESFGVLASGLHGNNGELSQGPIGFNGQINFDGGFGTHGGIGGAGLQGGSGSFNGIIPAVGSLADNKGLLGLLAGAAQGLKGGLSGSLNLQPGIVNSQTNLGLQGEASLEANKGGFSSTASNSASNSASSSAEVNADLIAKSEGGQVKGRFSKNSAASSSSSSSSSSFVSYSKDGTLPSLN